ncbi:MAG TPA: hypothetical protein VF026_19625, partial [Ktedonobacteraceae bacterium]
QNCLDPFAHVRRETPTRRLGVTGCSYLFSLIVLVLQHERKSDDSPLPGQIRGKVELRVRQKRPDVSQL